MDIAPLSDEAVEEALVRPQAMGVFLVRRFPGISHVRRELAALGRALYTKQSRRRATTEHPALPALVAECLWGTAVALASWAPVSLGRRQQRRGPSQPQCFGKRFAWPHQHQHASAECGGRNGASVYQPWR